MKADRMALIYFLICLLFITLGSLTKNFNAAQLFILPIGLIAVLFQKFIHKQIIKDLGFRKCRLADIGKAFAFPSLIIFLIFSVDFIFGFVKIKSLTEVRNPFSRGQTVTDIWLLFLIILISAFFTFVGSLVTEELGFRGYLISRLGRAGWLKAIVSSSLLFGLWHLPPSLILLGSGPLRSAVYVFNIFLLGILFGYSYLESRSLLSCSLFHGIWNALEYTLFGYGNEERVFYGGSRLIFDPEEGLVGTAVLLVFSIFILWKLKKRNVNHDIEVKR